MLDFLKHVGSGKGGRTRKDLTALFKLADSILNDEERRYDWILDMTELYACEGLQFAKICIMLNKLVSDGKEVSDGRKANIINSANIQFFPMVEKQIADILTQDPHSAPSP